MNEETATEKLLATVRVSLNGEQNPLLSEATSRILPTSIRLREPNTDLGGGGASMLSIKYLDGLDYTLCDVLLPSGLNHPQAFLHVPIAEGVARRIAGPNSTFYAVSDCGPDMGPPKTVIVDLYGIRLD